MKTISFRLTGTQPLMLNNCRTTNPLDFYTKKIKEVTSKKTKTDEDQLEIFRLKFLASVYTNAKGEYIVPANMLAASFEAGAKENKLGAKFTRSTFIDSDAMLVFPHNKCTPEQIWEEHNDTYVDIRAVGIMKAKVMAARMIVPEWSLTASLSFDETQLNDNEVWLAIVNAGLHHGIGTYRKIYGRYTVEEIKTKDERRKTKA